MCSICTEDKVTAPVGDQHDHMIDGNFIDHDGEPAVSQFVAITPWTVEYRRAIEILEILNLRPFSLSPVASSTWRLLNWFVDVETMKCSPSFLILITRSFSSDTPSYFNASFCAFFLNSSGLTPSCVKYPWDSSVTLFLGSAASMISVRFNPRPKFNAALRPAGPHR